MTQKIRKFKLLLTLVLAGFLLYSCQIEKEFTNDSLYEEKGAIMHKKFDELVKDSQFKTAYDKVIKPQKVLLSKKNTASKTVMEQQYNFTIVDKPANVVISSGITSYTFLIKRDNTPTNVFENLIINMKLNEEPKAYLYKFESSTPIRNATYNPSTFVGTKTLTPIIYNATESKIFAGEGFICAMVQEWHCPNHESNVSGCEGYGTSSLQCFFTGGGGATVGSSGTSGSGPSGSGGSGGGTGPNIVTAPVVLPSIENDPCVKILRMKNISPTISTDLETLGDKRTEPNEHGLIKVDNSPNVTTVQGTPGEINITLPATGSVSIYGHTHNSPASDTYSIFGYHDFLTLVGLIKIGRLSPDCVITLATADGTNYAMTIDDMAVFAKFFESDKPGNDENIKNHNKVIRDYYGLLENSTNALIEPNGTDLIGDEINFLKMIQDFNMGVSLLETNATFTTFTKVTYDKKKKMKIAQPCNN